MQALTRNQLAQTGAFAQDAVQDPSRMTTPLSLRSLTLRQGAAGQIGGALGSPTQRREKVTVMLALVSCWPGTMGVDAASPPTASRS